jgi:hypothetical protein
MIISGVALRGVRVIDAGVITDNLQVQLTPTSYAGSGTTWTDTQGNANATLYNSPTYSAGIGFAFDGSTQYGTMPSINGITNFGNTDNYTIEVWYNPSSGQTDISNSVLEKWNSNNEGAYPYVLRVNSVDGTGADIRVFNVGGVPQNPAAGISTTAGAWVQFVGTVNFATGTLTAYKNGTSQNTASIAGMGNPSNTSLVAIATRLGVGGVPQAEESFKGSVGIIRIYNRVLLAAEVLQNYNVNRGLYGL